MERQENNNPAHQSPRKKKHKHTKKPRLEDAWIGNGPLPASLSTEQLLDAIQAQTKPAYPSDEKTPIANTTSVISAEVPTILSKAHPKNTLRHMLSFHRVESTSSCMEEDEKAEATPERPSSPPLYEIQRLRAGFLIAMPRPPPVPSSLRSRSTSNISVSASSRESDNDDWSLSDSKLNDSYLWDGELPELSVGISTICIPIPRSSPSPRP
ncbi:hypothetical protein FRC17_003172 [Serendipita sp. 399]|nr:hypothetical protein FRC17_003172 [Serendipita sp. 399]